jgi:hypothetical protein
MSPFFSMKPNIDKLKETKDLEGLVNASMQPDEKISKAAVNAIIDLILKSYPPPLPPGGEPLFVPAALKIMRLPDLCFISRVPRSRAIERLSEIMRTGSVKMTSSDREGAVEMLIYLGSTDLLEQFLLDTKQEEQGFLHCWVVKCLAAEAVQSRNLMLLKKLLITEWSFDTEFGIPFGAESLLKELEEKELMDIFIGASSTSARMVACTALGSVGGLTSLSLLSSVASEGIRAALTKLGREDVKRALQKSYHSSFVYKNVNVVDDDAERIQSVVRQALKDIIGRLPFNQILPLCESDQEHLRNPALLVACQAADPKALSVIISASQAEDTDAVSASIGALRKVGGPDAVHALLPLLKHHSRQVWLSAAVALSEIDVQEAVAGILDLQPERILDPAVLNALARLNVITQAASALRTALEQAPHENRVAALEVLTKVAPADQVAPLQDHFAQIYAAELNDEKWAVRNRAVDSLGQIGGTLALKALKEQLKNEADYDIRCVIEKILGLKDRGDAGGELGQG